MRLLQWWGGRYPQGSGTVPASAYGEGALAHAYHHAKGPRREDQFCSGSEDEKEHIRPDSSFAIASIVGQSSRAAESMNRVLAQAMIIDDRITFHEQIRDQFR